MTKAVVTDNVFVFARGNSSTHLISMEGSKPKRTAKSIWSFGIENTSDPLIFYIPDLSPSDTLPPNHPAWLKIEALFEQVNAIDHDDEEDAREWLQKLRTESDERISKFYETDDWD